MKEILEIIDRLDHVLSNVSGTRNDHAAVSADIQKLKDFVVKTTELKTV